MTVLEIALQNVNAAIAVLVRYRLVSAGIVGAGLALTVALVLFARFGQATFSKEEDVAGSLSLPVLAVIPPMTSLLEYRADQHRTRIWWGTAVMVLACAAAIAVWWRLQS